MTTPASGTVGPNTVQITSYKLTSRITSIQNNNNISVNSRIIPIPPPTTPSVIVEGLVTSIPDSPGFVKLKTPAFFSPAQNVAIRSAAQNTATAFGLNVKIAADRATLQNRTVADLTIIPGIPATIDEIIIPP